jgi:hypothetical protein
MSTGFLRFFRGMSLPEKGNLAKVRRIREFPAFSNPEKNTGEFLTAEAVYSLLTRSSPLFIL